LRNPASESSSYCRGYQGENKASSNQKYLAFEHGLIVDRRVNNNSISPVVVLGHKVNCKSLEVQKEHTEGSRPLSFGGWKAPQYGYSDT
jgi:hypothetical protein